MPPPLTELEMAMTHESVAQTVQEYKLRLLRQMTTAYDLVLMHLQQKWMASKQRHDDDITEEHWRVGDLVHVHQTAAYIKTHMRKLTNPWRGPYAITAVQSDNRVEVLIPTPRDVRATQIVSTTRIRRYLAPMVQSWTPGRRAKFPQTVLSRRVRNGQPEYLVQFVADENGRSVRQWLTALHIPEELLTSFHQRKHLQRLPDDNEQEL